MNVMMTVTAPKVTLFGSVEDAEFLPLQSTAYKVPLASTALLNMLFQVPPFL